jgi:hypothetical protein
LKVLTRTSSHLSEQRVSTINQLSAAVDQVLPGFTKIFDHLASKTAVELLGHFSSPNDFLRAPKEDILNLICLSSRRSRNYAEKKYSLLMQCAEDALDTGVSLTAFYEIISVYAHNLKHINSQLDLIDQSIQDLSIHIPEISLMSTIPGMGKKLAPILAGEIGNINRFKNAKQLVAYCGIDPSVKQSGNFIGTKNKFTKRGSPFSRKALYISATVAVRKDAKGRCVNPVIYDYYQKKIQSKTKKQALGAVMNKLVRIIFFITEE